MSADKSATIIFTVPERLAAMDAKLDQLIETKKDQEQRIRVLEKRDAYVLGVAAVIAFAAQFLVKAVFKI